MTCPFCGSASAGTSGRCSACGRVVTGAAVAAATATPLPSSASLTVAMPAAGGPLAPGQEFGSRYRILKTLGAGGMGVVYQAWDQALDVSVALKVIRPEVLSDKTAAEEVERRFKRELLLARQVTHRNVVRIHDLGEIDGIKYISMPFIEGKDLASVLAENGRLPVKTAIEIMRQVGEGLRAAHEAGVVHRDLKPENVMIEADGRAVIMDFGISRSASGGTTLGLTVAGSVVGTIEYMAPEQALGQAVDQRADIYALGLIAYDMLAGRQRLATVTTPVTEMMQRLQQAPPPVRSKTPEVPAELERIVGRALEPDPQKRYQHIGELLADLDAFAEGEAPRRRARRVPLAALIATVLVVVVLAAGAVWYFARSRGAPVAREPLSVLIADFDNRTGDPIFEGSLEQALAIAMEGSSFVTVFPRKDARTIAAQLAPAGGGRIDQPVGQLISRREGLKVLLAGSMSSEGSGYRVAIRAVDPADGRVIKAAERRVDGKPAVLPAISALADVIREELGESPTVMATEAKEETFTTASLDAVREYSLAQDLASAGKYEQAIAHYEKATRLDPNFGRAFSGWALSAFDLGRHAEATELWKKALSLMDRMTDREKYRTLGLYYVAVAEDYDKGIENFSALVKAYPADGVGYSNLSVAYFLTLDFTNALEAGRKAVEIYPRNAKFRNNMALFAMYAGDFETAAREARTVIKEAPSFVKAYLPVAMTALAARRTDDARAAYEQMAGVGERGASLAAMGRADIAMYHGRPEEAVQILTAGLAADVSARNMAGAAAKRLALAEAYLDLGQAAEAVRAAREAVAERERPLVAFGAAGILTRAGRHAEARTLAQQLLTAVQPQTRALGKLIEGQVALAQGQQVPGLDALREAKRLADLWLVRFELGVAYVETGRYAEAVSELEACEKRRGEATAVLLDDVPSIRYLAPVSYWLARAQEGLGIKSAAAENYRKYLEIRSGAGRDPLAADARRRLASF